MIRKTSIIVMLLVFGTATLLQAATVQKKITELKSGDGKTIVIPLKNLKTDALYYSYKSKDTKGVQFFVLLDNEKKPHAAFDACEICYAAKKGYRQEGTMSVCNNCGNKYPVSAIGTKNKTGGCWPAYLPYETDKDNIVIKLATLTEKQYLFPK